jgi:hypothetical protein
VNVETKEQPKQWMHAHSPNKMKNFKQMCARKLMAAVLWDRKGVLMVEFMQQGTTVVYCETIKKTALGHSERKALNAGIWCTCSAPSCQCMSAYSCLLSSTAGAFQVGVV